MIKLPDSQESYWRQAYPKKALYPRLNQDMEADTIIIGAGITGLTTAYLLKQSGLKVVVLDKATVGGGTTARSTCKVTSQHNLVYADLESRLGERVARDYGMANEAAIQQIDSIIKTQQIDCDWRHDDNYVYTTEISKVKELKHEAAIAAGLGLPASFTTDTPLPFDTVGAVKFSDQATFNSQKYLLGLARAVDGDGSFVFEHSNVTSIKDGSPCRVKTKDGSVTATNIVVATNVPTLPLAARGGYCIKEYPRESFIVAGRPTKPIKGMYISPDKGHYSILQVEDENGPLILIGGESNISGVRHGSKYKYKRLAEYAQKHFGVETIDYQWSDRDYLSYDSVPIIGKMYPWSKHLYVGTAFMKWGLSNGTVAAMILSDLITEQENPWVKPFDSNRFSPVASIPRVASKYIFRK